MTEDEMMIILMAAFRSLIANLWNRDSMDWLAQARADFYRLVRRIAPQIAKHIIDKFVALHRSMFERIKSKYGFEGLPVAFLFYMELWQEKFVQNMMQAFDTVTNTTNTVLRGVRSILDGTFQTLRDLNPPNPLSRLRALFADTPQRDKNDETPRPKRPRPTNIRTPILDRIVKDSPENKKRLKLLKQSKLGQVIVRMAEGLLGLLGFDSTPLEERVESIIDAVVEDLDFQADRDLTEKVAQELNIETYRWRTMRDERVRDTHRALEGTIRTWDQYPRPGQEENCRCWAELV
jgi:hypothetical protein